MEIFMICLKIFLARTTDVTFGTLKTIYIMKGKKLFSTTLAFVEVFIWFLIAREALNTTLDSIFIPISYAAGYAFGTYVGMFISEYFIDSIIGLQVITTQFTKEMAETIRSNGYAVSIIDLRKEKGKVNKVMLVIQTHKSKYQKLIKLVKSMDGKAFIIINETKYVQNGYLK